MVPAIIAGGIAAASIASNLYNSYKNREDAADAYDDIESAANDVVARNNADINSYRKCC